MPSKGDTPKMSTLGLSYPADCSYIIGQQEQLLIMQNELNANYYERMLALGFRRNGEQLYKPHCLACQACLPIRIPIRDLQLSKSQKRVLSKNKALDWQLTSEMTDDFFPLYEKYLTQRHNDGDMYPANTQAFNQVHLCSWSTPQFVCVYDKAKLIAVGVVDLLSKSASAVYSYFDPDYQDYSLGVLLILLECQMFTKLEKQFLYLGFQIDANKKMNYKRRFRPYEILTAHKWQKGE